MATRKPDSEVGPLGVWAYDTARSLDLSAEQVAKRVGANPATIRKIEGGSSLRPSRRLIEDMDRFFHEVANERGRAVTGPPAEWSAKPTPAMGQDDLIAALHEQTVAISELAAQVKALADRPQQDEVLVGVVAAAVALAVRTTLQAAGLAYEPPEA